MLISRPQVEHPHSSKLWFLMCKTVLCPVPTVARAFRPSVCGMNEDVKVATWLRAVYPSFLRSRPVPASGSADEVVMWARDLHSPMVLCGPKSWCTRDFRSLPTPAVLRKKSTDVYRSYRLWPQALCHPASSLLGQPFVAFFLMPPKRMLALHQQCAPLSPGPPKRILT